MLRWRDEGRLYGWTKRESCTRRGRAVKVGVGERGILEFGVWAWHHIRYLCDLWLRGLVHVLGLTVDALCRLLRGHGRRESLRLS